MSGFTVAWALWLIAFCVIEALALRAGTGTLSAHVWAALAEPYVRPFVVALGVWLAWHWYLEPPWFAELRRTYVDDVLIAAGAVLLSHLLGRRRK